MTQGPIEPDIVERLREWDSDYAPLTLLDEAADEIERLRKALIDIYWLAGSADRKAEMKIEALADRALKP